jgi:hypothetical protein
MHCLLIWLVYFLLNKTANNSVVTVSLQMGPTYRCVNCINFNTLCDGEKSVTFLRLDVTRHRESLIERNGIAETSGVSACAVTVVLLCMFNGSLVWKVADKIRSEWTSSWRNFAAVNFIVCCSLIRGIWVQNISYLRETVLGNSAFFNSKSEDSIEFVVRSPVPVCAA